jgi:hypothetical protein
MFKQSLEEQQALDLRFTKKPGSGFTKRLDPDPDSMNPDPKHWYRT